ncbi:hypothetical protein [Nitrospina watsonii]|uniref:Uncharacterized protein n=1 Tax=Nitrospina watsonii TaxID=1323948 RepID=A0ABM9HF03_9BACT|nr:hypothetical protein [Nitrospina watsonii]CAI2718625.1 conserved protein of unknown function [Nitrospina watsonii]
MKKYEIHSVCDACGDTHPTRHHVMLENGPDETKTVEEIWEGQDLPGEVKAVLANPFQCPVTKSFIRQEETDQVFLVPLSYK